MKNPSFADLYCALHGLKQEEFNLHLLKRALYPHARLIRPVLEFACPNYFSADNDFVCEVALLTRYNEFFDSCIEFVHHPENRGLLRQMLRVRVSTDRMRRIVRQTLREPLPTDEEPKGTMSPMGDPRKRGNGSSSTAPTAS